MRGIIILWAGIQAVVTLSITLAWVALPFLLLFGTKPTLVQTIVDFIGRH